MTRAKTLAIVAAALVMIPEVGAAQRHGGGAFISGPIEAGPRVGRDFENHAWSLGAQVRVPVGQKLELRPSGDFFFPKGGKRGWQANGDAAIKFGPGGTVYAGGGIAFVHLGDDKTRTGYNLFFGFVTAQPEAVLKPFVEFRWTFVNGTSPFRLAAGFTRRFGS